MRVIILLGLLLSGCGQLPVIPGETQHYPSLDTCGALKAQTESASQLSVYLQDSGNYLLLVGLDAYDYRSFSKQTAPYPDAAIQIRTLSVLYCTVNIVNGKLVSVN